MELYPFKFAPIYQERIWGGRNLARLFGRALPAEKKIGESWELADLAEGTSVVANGPHAGKTLTELTCSLRPLLLGKARPAPGGRFPLLLKHLDAEETLSLQVHPDSAAAKRIGRGAAPKTECWHVLESRGGFIYKGLRAGVTRRDFEAAVRENREEEVLRRHDVKAGDFHYLPAGTVHALGAGVVVAEIQTPSDTTYRVTDWGRGRPTHLAEALECIHFEESPDSPPGAAGDVLVDCEYFKVERLAPRPHEPLSWPGGQCSAVMVLDGSLTLVHGPNHSFVEPVVDVHVGETVLLPAGLPGVRDEPLESAAVLRITLAAT
jgi:mannose-6-phosphate isomerase